MTSHKEMVRNKFQENDMLPFRCQRKGAKLVDAAFFF